MVTVSYLVVRHPTLYVTCYIDVHRNKKHHLAPPPTAHILYGWSLNIKTYIVCHILNLNKDNRGH